MIEKNICFRYNLYRCGGNMYRIGEFAKITGLSITTLRYYDEIDLFKPEEIDIFTNYRYYNVSQIEDIKIINDLKEIGFSLEEIKKYWNNFSNQIMLEKKQELLREQEVISEKIKKLDIMRSHINNGKITNDINKKEEVKVKSIF